MAWYNGTMANKITIDNAGRIVIPKAVRLDLQLQPGDELIIDSTADEITLTPVRESAALVKEMGIWVYKAGGIVTDEDVIDMIDAIRDERMKEILG